MPKYRSEIKNAVSGKLIQDPDASNHQLCQWMDETGNVELPPTLAKNGNRSFVSAYADSKVRHNLESRFAEVRRDMRAAGHSVP